MGYFVAYRHTGADIKRLEELLPVVCDGLKERKQQVYCTFFDETEFKSSGLNSRQIMDRAFAKIEEMDGLFVVLDTPEKSEGMLMEVGYCLAKDIRIILAKRVGIDDTYLPSVAHKFLEYNDIEDLKSKIEEMELSKWR